MNNIPDMFPQRSTIETLKDIDKQLREELAKPDTDKKKVLDLRMKKLYEGMWLTNGIGFNNNRRGIPY